MPPPLSSHTATIVVTTAGALSGAVTLAWGVSCWLRRRQVREDTDFPTATWTPHQVAAWLRENGVSKASVVICCRYKVDGDTLVRLTSHDLYRMGVPLRDARVILACIEDVKDGPVLSRASSHPSSPPTKMDHPALPSSLEQFEAAWQALLQTSGLPASVASQAEHQQRLALCTGALLESFQALDVNQQAAALSLLDVGENVPVFPAGSASREVQPTPTKAQVPVDLLFPTQPVEEKLKPLHRMLDGFLDFLRSPDLDAVGPAEFEELGDRVAAQVKRILRVAEQLPPKLGSALLLKCNSVFEALSRHQQPDDSGKETADKTTPMQALHNVLAVLGDPALRELPAAERVKVLSSLAKRAEAIEAAAARSVSSAPKGAEILSMVRSLLQMIREAIRASEKDAEDDARSAAGEKDENGEAIPTEDADGAVGQIPLIVRTVKDIQGTLQSEEFQHAPSAVKLKLCTALLQRLTVLESDVATLPSPAQAMVRDLLSNTKSVLAVIVAAAETGEDIGKKNSTADDGAQEEKRGNDRAHGTEEGRGQDTDAGIEAYVAQLEKIFDFLTSDTLERATVEERQRVAARLLQQVEVIKAGAAAHDPQGALITELIGPLQDLLSGMAGSRVASREFLEMTAPLSDVRRLLTSESFQQVPNAEKMRIARRLVPQLQQIASSFSSLSDSERVAAEDLMRPITEVLLSVMRDTNPDTGSAQVFERLQMVVRAIRDTGLTTMSPAARGAWAARTVAELDRLRLDCAPLGAEGEALMPIIGRLRGQLTGLLPVKSGAADSEGPEDSGDVEPTHNGDKSEAQQQPDEELESSVWDTVRAMCTELVSAEKSAAPVPLERLQGILRIMREAAEQPDISVEQEEALQELGSLLRRQMGVNAKDSGGVAEGDDNDGSSDDVAEATLPAFRRSLQVLAEMLHDENVPTAALAMVASKTEELIASADAVNINWREDSRCAQAVRSILEALQQSRASEGDASLATAPNSLEAVLQSSIAALIADSPTDKEGFTPYMRLLHLAQQRTEQMTNKELVLLKSFQEAVIEAMQRLPKQPPRDSGKDGVRTDAEAVESDDSEADKVDEALKALLDMSLKLRERSLSVEELDELERIQQHLESLLAAEGVDAEDAVKAVREQIRVQRDKLESSKAIGQEDVEELEKNGNRVDNSQPEVQLAEKQTSGPPQPDSSVAFNEDDDDMHL
ncbi:hypothetical protein JKF63_07979 [Porcisia hertigi]|uniref:SAM domain-containing protein n=1 Tax=Porcisia hertigi TaxID=2761500 RepID=A0A836L5C2_9TRYP|nr:hypothetical protein JKF63_07979 [Porcisia hertigi]